MSTPMELIHSDKYASALSLCKKFVSKQNFRILLTFVNHLANGNMVATDSHRMIILKNMHGYKEDTLVNPYSFEVAKGGTYPDTKRIVPEIEDTHILLDVAQVEVWFSMFSALTKTLKSLKRKNSVVALQFQDSRFEFKTEIDNVIFTLPKTEYQKPKDIDVIFFNAQYMRDALEAHTLMKSQAVSFKFKSQYMPFLIDNEEDVQALVLPVRKNQ